MKKLLTVALISLLSFAGISQTSPAQSVRVNMKPVSATGERLAGDDLESNPSTAPFNDISLIVEIPSETGIATIKVQLNRPDGTSIVAYDYTFDQTSGLPTGITYQRNGKRVMLGLGKYSGVNHYTVNIVLVDASGVESEALVVSK